MKKAIAVFLTCLLMLAACGKPKTAAFEPERSFSADFELKNERMTITGTIFVYAYSDIRMRFTSPEALTHCVLTLTPEGCKMDIGDISGETEAWELPEDAPALLIGEALRAAVFTKQEFTADAQGNRIARPRLSGGISAQVTFTPDGALTKLRTDAGLTVTFSSFQKI